MNILYVCFTINILDSLLNDHNSDIKYSFYCVGLKIIKIILKDIVPLIYLENSEMDIISILLIHTAGQLILNYINRCSLMLC